MKNQMKSINSALSFVAMSALVLMTAACGNPNSTLQSSANNPGAGAVGANVDMKDCQIGQSYSSEYGCLNRASCSQGSGFSAQANTCVAGQVVTGQTKFGSNAVTRHFGILTVTNPSQMELLLQAAGLCNGGYNGISYSSIASSRCSQWIARGAFAAVTSYQGSADGANIVIGAGTQSLTYDLVQTLSAVDGSSLGVYGAYGYGASAYAYGSSNYISFSQQAHSYAFNNKNGIQIVGVAPNRESINFMVLVENGNLGLDRMEAKLVYQGVQVATVNLNRF